MYICVRIKSVSIIKRVLLDYSSSIFGQLQPSVYYHFNPPCLFTLTVQLFLISSANTLVDKAQTDALEAKKKIYAIVFLLLIRIFHITRRNNTILDNHIRRTHFNGCNLVVESNVCESELKNVGCKPAPGTVCRLELLMYLVKKRGTCKRRTTEGE